MNIRKMNISFLSLSLILVCCFSFFSIIFTDSAWGVLADELLMQDPWRKISLDLEDASLLSVLKVFSQQSGMNFIASQEIANRTVTLYLENVPVRDALDKILKTYNLTYDLDEDSNIFVVRETAEQEADKKITKVYTLKYARVNSSPLNSASSNSTAGSSLADALSDLLSPEGKISEDSRTNSLIITDLPERFVRLEEMIRKLDIPVPQVLIEAEIIDVKKSLADQIGMEWAGSIYTLTLASRTGLAFPFNAWHNRDAKTEITTGSISATSDDDDVSATLQMLITDVDTKVLARPRILTLSNETAEIKIVGNNAVGTATTTNSESGTENTSAERYEIGVSLKVTPSVSIETGEITMVLEPKVSSADVSSLGTTYYDPQERSAKTTVSVKSNDTVVIGGLLRKDLSDTRKKVPFLGDIPLAGMLFRHKSGSNQDRELLVFITPRIINTNAVNANLAQSQASTYNKDVLMEREQSDYQYRREEVDKALNVWDNK
ncbi:MAG: secretin N-terminal domain-containing protein [Candidatus Omnitrophica bacterium]|nr:secretin N-terminal domain-containing protein [Candidatus Omnitrophota bacterium]